jgi:hypothetical protein
LWWFLRRQGQWGREKGLRREQKSWLNYEVKGNCRQEVWSSYLWDSFQSKLSLAAQILISSLTISEWGLRDGFKVVNFKFMAGRLTFLFVSKLIEFFLCPFFLTNF